MTETKTEDEDRKPRVIGTSPKKKPDKRNLTGATVVTRRSQSNETAGVIFLMRHWERCACCRRQDLPLVSVTMWSTKRWSTDKHRHREHQNRGKSVMQSTDCTPSIGNQDILAEYCRGCKHCINHVGASSHSATKRTKASLTDGERSLLMNHQQRRRTDLIVMVGKKKRNSDDRVLVYKHLPIESWSLADRCRG
jgi:hypothetical protein